MPNLFRHSTQKEEVPTPFNEQTEQSRLTERDENTQVSEPLLFVLSSLYSFGGSAVSETHTSTSVMAGQTYVDAVERGHWNFYSFLATSVDAIDWILTMGNPMGEDCDMYVKQDSSPSLWDWDYANVSLADVLGIHQTEVISGATYYLGVYGYLGCQYNCTLVLNKVS